MPADLVNGSYRFPVDDRVYWLRAEIDRATEKRFELYAYEREVNKLAAGRAMYTPAEYSDKRESLEKLHDLGLFAFRMSRGVKTLATEPGIKFLICDLLGDGATDDDVIALLAEHAEEVKGRVTTIIRDSMEQTTKAAKKKRAAEKSGTQTPATTSADTD